MPRSEKAVCLEVLRENKKKLRDLKGEIAWLESIVGYLEQYVNENSVVPENSQEAKTK